MADLAYLVEAQRKSVLFTAAALMLWGCSAGVKPATTGTAGTGGGGPGTAGVQGSAGTQGSGGTGPGIGGFGGSIITNPDAGACQSTDYHFERKIPTVYLVVDRSGSMFHCLSTSELVCSTKSDTSWSQLKTAIEAVLPTLDDTVRLGFTTVFGTNPSGGGSCPLLTGTLADNVPPALNNASTIMGKYDSLDAMWPNPSDAMNTGKKFESPASEAITATTKALMADTTPGDKFIIFITDGQEDYCDDALEICASDSTVGAIQAAAAAKIKTIVFGLQTTQFNLPGAVLQAFANAGASEPTVASVPSGLDTTAIFDQCQGVTPWRTDLTASGHPTTRGPTATVGTYMATMGPTAPFKPSSSDQMALHDQLLTALSGVKSCVFDLSNINGKSIKVDTTQLNKASVVIQGMTIPLDPTNGWNMITGTQLQLSGSACDTWHNPMNNDIMFNFPCEIIVE